MEKDIFAAHALHSRQSSHWRISHSAAARRFAALGHAFNGTHPEVMPATNATLVNIPYSAEWLPRMAWMLGQKALVSSGDAAPTGGAMEGQRILFYPHTGRSTDHVRGNRHQYVPAPAAGYASRSISAAPLYGLELRVERADRELRVWKADAMKINAACRRCKLAGSCADDYGGYQRLPLAMIQLREPVVLVSDIARRRWFVKKASEKHYVLYRETGHGINPFTGGGGSGLNVCRHYHRCWPFLCCNQRGGTAGQKLGAFGVW